MHHLGLTQIRWQAGRMTLPGLEPPVFGCEDQCFIHQATEPRDVKLS